MGRKPSITPAQGQQLLEAYGRLGNKSAAAREIGVSEDAAARYLAATPQAAAPVLAQQREIIESAGASLFDSAAALDEHYQGLRKLLKQLDAGIMEERNGPRGPYVTQTPIATNVAAFRAAREYVEAAMRMLELMHSVEEQRKFHQAVLEAIAKADEPTRQRVIENLRQLRAAGLALNGP